METTVTEGRGGIKWRVEDCNLKCRYCFCWKERNEGGSLPTLIDAGEKIDELEIAGGEPFATDIIPLLRRIRKQVDFIKIKTNGTYPSKLRSVLYEWLVDYVELHLVAPVTKCDSFCGEKVNPDLFIASITSLQNWAGEQKIVIHAGSHFSEEDLSLTADLLEGSRSIQLIIHDNINISPEIEEKFRRIAGNFEILKP